MSGVVKPPPRTRRPGRSDPAVAVELRRATRQGLVPSTTALERWTALTLGRRGRGCELSVLVVGPARSRSLNRRYRGQDHPTNLLAFPAARGGALLGDLVICSQVLRREARAQGKAARAHWMHLVVHGTLHLIGYEHDTPAQARRMERREVRVLRALGVANPYRSA